MHDDVMDDHHKQRLTSREDIEGAIALLEAEGIADVDLLVEMLKSFYVDLDEFDAVMRQAA